VTFYAIGECVFEQHHSVGMRNVGAFDQIANDAMRMPLMLGRLVVASSFSVFRSPAIG
jgi:hypothetical protein